MGFIELRIRPTPTLFPPNNSDPFGLNFEQSIKKILSLTPIKHMLEKVLFQLCVLKKNSKK